MSINANRGFTMVEAMVALVVLAVGMLGIAGLYVTTLRSGSGAIYRTQAINLATDMADRIRANKFAGIAYQNAPAYHNCAGTGSVDCTPVEMAENDLLSWTQAVTGTLPNANGNVVVAPAVPPAPAAYTITVSWVEQGGQTQSYVLQMQI